MSIRAWRSGQANPVLAEQAPPEQRAEREELERLAVRVSRLGFSWRSPEEFAVERSEISHALRRLARDKS